MNCKECGSSEQVEWGRCLSCRRSFGQTSKVGKKIMRVTREVRAYCPDCEGECHCKEEQP
jgi:hypothetical protein